MKYRSLLALFLLGLIVLAGAHEGESDDRETQSEVSGSGEVEAESTTKTGTQKDKFKLKIESKGNNDLSIKAEYFKEGSTSEMSYHFFVRLAAIQQYNGNSLIKTYDIGSSGWSQITLDNPPDSTGITNVTAQTTDGVFTAILRYSGVAWTYNGVGYNPNEIKIDIEVTNFPYQTGDSTTHLVLLGRVRSHVEVSEGGSDSANFGGGYLEWAKTYTADGASKTVDLTTIAVVPDDSEDSGMDKRDDSTSGSESSTTGSKEQETKKNFQFSWDFTNSQTATNIVWDPTIGIGSSATGLAVNLFALLCLVLIALF